MWQFAGWDQQSNGSALPRRTGNQSLGFQSNDHLMYGRRCDPEIVLHVSLRGSAPHNLSVVVDEGQILPLFFSVRSIHAKTTFNRLGKSRERDVILHCTIRKAPRAGLSECGPTGMGRYE